MVVAVFYLVGWEMGAVEAVSLSILVGSSVDYCVHLVEGYLIAGNNPPPSVSGVSTILALWYGCTFHIAGPSVQENHRLPEDFQHKWSVMQSFDGFFVVGLHKFWTQLSGQRFKT